MTATAFPPGRSPPLLPSPHKPMPAGHRKGRRGGCLGGLQSCFGSSPVADSDGAGHPVDQRGRRSSWFTWSKFRKKQQKKKKTVPVDAPSEELALGKKAGDDRGPQAAGRVLHEKAAGKGGHVQNNEEEKDEGKQHRRCTTAPSPAAIASLGQRFFEKLRKGKCNTNKGGPTIPISGSHKDEVSKSNQRQRPPQQTRLAFLSPKFDARRGPPAHTPPEPARTAAPSRKCRTSAAPAAGGTLPPSSPAAPPPQYSKTSPPHAAAAASRLGGVRSQKNTPKLEPRPSLPAGRNDQLLGLSVMAVVLVMMVLFGRATAVFFTCLWLYCLPRVRTTMAEITDGGGSKSAAGIDLDSGEYKKKVVLEGLLQRDTRRMPGVP
ncbi:hypothetical protein Taro_041077 [Colocasia esculenta]|uniref:Uncharacterized protein n=1 Tax=Colocasia esculenta TaxID=4460 RepID=A0A843WKL3_COLES|nr:hypothetical protein [Colocasia esculenta]